MLFGRQEGWRYENPEPSSKASMYTERDAEKRERERDIIT